MEGIAAKQIGIRVPVALNKRLQALARGENNHVSAVTRRLLTGAIDREEAMRAARRSDEPAAREDARPRPE